MSSSLDMALEASGKPTIMITSASQNFKQSKICAVEYDDAKDWVTAKYVTKFIIKEKDLLNDDVEIVLHLDNGHKVPGQMTLVEAQDVPPAVRKQAEIEICNQQTFELIQQIQSQDVQVNKKQAFEKLQLINKSLDTKYEECLAIKGRITRKKLMAQLQECRTRTSQVISELRGVSDFSNIQNSLIAKMNDLAYKARNNCSLQKMVDKRAIANEELYEKLEKEAADITSKMDFEKLAETHKSVIEEIGNCPLSVMNTVEALEEQDCMCIGLSVTRPEAAIADSSRLVIKDIFPTYISAESFLQSAQFKISNSAGDGAAAHGGFDAKQKEGQLAMGLGRENITGVLPLYLFQEHWNVAKRKIQPILGLMCTLDIMGYTSEQFFTVPFTVLMKAASKLQENPTSEVCQRMYGQVENTCIQIIASSATFRANTIESVVKFAYPGDKESTRTSDVVKSVGVLTLQF